MNEKMTRVGTNKKKNDIAFRMGVPGSTTCTLRYYRMCVGDVVSIIHPFIPRIDIYERHTNKHK